VGVAAHAVSDTAVWSDGEGGDFFVYGLDGLFELLGGGREDKERINTKSTEKGTEDTEREKERV